MKRLTLRAIRRTGRLSLRTLRGAAELKAVEPAVIPRQPSPRHPVSPRRGPTA